MAASNRPERLFRTVTPSDGKSSHSAAPLPPLPIVGRDAELGRLADLARGVAAGRPGLLSVVGEAGVGKTRLLAEFSRRCRTLGVRAFIVPAVDHPMPYALFGRLLSDMAKVYFPGRTEPDGATGAVRALLRGEPVAGDDPGPVHGSIRAFLSTISGVTPVMLLLDDVARADAASLSALFFVCRVVAPQRDARLGIVLAGRPEALEQNPVAQELERQLVEQAGSRLELGRLDDGSVAELIGRAFPGHEIDARLAPLVMGQSQGNPSFALSLLELMMADGTLAMDGSWVRIAGDHEPKLPATIVDLVLQRLSELADKERRLLAQASVAGARLEVDHLVRGLGWGRSDVTATLNGMASRGRFVRLTGGQYEFDPAVASEVIEKELLDGPRARLHDDYARYLEEKHGADPERAMEMAFHLEAAARPADAAAAYMAAARHARQRYAWTIARRGFERYLALAGPATQSADADRVEALTGSAQAMLEMGHLADAEAPLAQATELAKRLPGSAERGRVIWLAARRLFLLGDSRAALVAARRAQEIFEGMGDESSLARVVELKGDILNRSGSFEEAEIALEASLLLFTKVGDRAGRASVLLKLATIARDAHRFERAMSYIEQSLDTAREIEDGMREAEVIHQAGVTRWQRGERAQGQALIREAIRMAQTLANPRVEAEALGDLAYALGEEGDLAAALTAATEARDLLRALADRPGEARCHAVLASLYAIRGPHDEARAYGSAAVLILDEVGDHRTRAWVLAVLARVAVATGDMDHAQQLATESLGLSEKLADHGISGMALAVLGSLLVEKGDPRAAREMLERSLADLGAAKSATHLPRVRAMLGRATYAAGDRDAGLRLLQEAVAEADELGSPVARAETVMEFGRALGPDTAEGQAVLEPALMLAQEAGLEPVVARINQLLGMAP